MDCQRVRSLLEKRLDSKWGFVIYRCTYSDDAAWDRFMSHLNTRVRLGLEADGGADLLPRLNWSVQEDPSLNEADAEEVRSRFSTWITSGPESSHWQGIPRYHACVRVDKFLLEQVLEGPPAEEFDADGMGFVELVSLDEEEGEQLVGLSYLVPRIYTLLEGPGWKNFAVKDEVATP